MMYKNYETRHNVKRSLIITHFTIVDALQSALDGAVLCKSLEEILDQEKLEIINQVNDAVGLWLTNDQWNRLLVRLSDQSLIRSTSLKVELILSSQPADVHDDRWPLPMPESSSQLVEMGQWKRLVNLQSRRVQSWSVQRGDQTAHLLYRQETAYLEIIGPLRALSQKIPHDQAEALTLCQNMMEIVEEERSSIHELRTELYQSASMISQAKHSYSLKMMIRETLKNLSCPLSWYEEQMKDFEAEVIIDDTRRGLTLLVSQISLFDTTPKISLSSGVGQNQAMIEIVAKNDPQNSSHHLSRFSSDVNYVREIAERQGGALQVHSTMSGSIKLSWIFSAATELDSVQEVQTENVSVKSHIWLIDDEPSVRLTVRRWLQHLGYSVEVFEEGPILLDALQKAQPMPALIICDADMPVMTGLEVLSRVSKATPQVKRLLYTAREPNRWVIEAFNQGVIHRFIDKTEGPKALKVCLDEMLQDEESHIVQIQALNELLSEQMLMLHIQPIFSAETREVEAVEALMRSQHPAFRGPLDILNATQLAQREFDLQRVLTTLSKEVRVTIPSDIKLFMNIDPFVFGYPDRLDDVFSEVYPYASSIVLELTERGQLCGDAWVESVRYLREKGFEIALDDLGAGYNSLGAVAAVSPEIIKLDISLVSNVHLSSPKREMVRLLSEYAIRHQIKTVAEGIEVGEEATVCTELGMKWLQGYHLDRPMPVEQFIATHLDGRETSKS